MIVGVIGFIGSGKGTVADILVRNHGFTKLSFADAVKDATAAIFGWPRHLLEGDSDTSRAFRELKDAFWTERLGYDVTPRKMLQIIGTEAGREVIHDDIWVYALERKMNLYPKVVIADVRFPNEIDFIQSKGGFVTRVKRGPEPEWYNDALFENTATNRISGVNVMQKLHPDVHYSEWAWIGHETNYHIDNEGTLEDLTEATEKMLQFFRQSDIMLD